MCIGCWLLTVMQEIRTYIELQLESGIIVNEGESKQLKGTTLVICCLMSIKGIKWLFPSIVFGPFGLSRVSRSYLILFFWQNPILSYFLGNVLYYPNLWPFCL